MVGAMEGTRYRCDRLVLEPGDSLFLYTDGVTEAMNIHEECYSNERLEQALAGVTGRGIRDGIDGIMADIRFFTGDAPQSDDITMMMVQYNGSKNTGA